MDANRHSCSYDAASARESFVHRFRILRLPASHLNPDYIIKKCTTCCDELKRPLWRRQQHLISPPSDDYVVVEGNLIGREVEMRTSIGPNGDCVVRGNQAIVEAVVSVVSTIH